MTPHLPDDRIPEDRVASILSRAVELDRATRETVSVEALRAAALDAGISEAALETALEEYASGATPRAPAGERKRRTWFRFPRLRALLLRLAGPARLAALAFALGFASGLGEGAFVIGLVAWAVMVVRLVLRERPRRRARGFVLSLVVMTLALAVGFAAGGVDGDVVVMLFSAGLAALVGGVLAIKLGLRSREIEAPAA